MRIVIPLLLFAFQLGAIVYARFGKGMYIYTGIAFFRQIPEGVPGAYRLFVNLLSATQNN